MKKLSLIFLIIIILVNMVGCSTNNKRPNVFIEKWNNIYDGDNIHFYYEDKKDVNLVQLNNQYNINKLLESGRGEFEKSLILLKWVNNKLKFSKQSSSDKKDAISILKEGENGNSVSNNEYVMAFEQLTVSSGIITRVGELRSKELFNTKEDYYYKVCEIWDDSMKKWIFIDVSNGCYIKKDGVPLSAIEIIEKGIDNTDIIGIKDVKKYLKNMRNYFYSYTIKIDNKIFTMQKSYASITYIKAGDTPQIKTKQGIIVPTIFVNKSILFNKSPLEEYKNINKDSIPTLILSKTNDDNQKNFNLYIGAFKDSINIEDYYISVNNSAWNKCPKYSNLKLDEGENNIRLSLDGKKVLREITIQHTKK